MTEWACVDTSARIAGGELGRRRRECTLSLDVRYTECNSKRFCFCSVMSRSQLHGAARSWWHVTWGFLRTQPAARRAAPWGFLPCASPSQALHTSILSCERAHGETQSQDLQRGRQMHVTLHSATEPSALPQKNASSRGPQPYFQAQIDSGTMRSDPRQVAAMGLLQDVYIQLEKLYPRMKKPSNLTMVSNISKKSNHDAWYVQRPAVSLHV